MSGIGFGYREVFGIESGHFECDICGVNVETIPCAVHAPLTPPPGLRLAECRATIPHFVFVHDREDYGACCPSCVVDELSARLADAEGPRGAVWFRAWRRWRIRVWRQRDAWEFGC